MEVCHRLSTDVLVVGAGAAGARAALGVAEAGAECIVVSKGPVSRCGVTTVAGGGMSAPFHPEDSEAAFFQDIVKCGHGLGDQNLIEMHVRTARQRILDLKGYGATFAENPDGTVSQYQSPGHSYPRNLTLTPSSVGTMTSLRKALLDRPCIRLLEDVAVYSLLKDDEGRASGGLAFDLKSGESIHIRSKATILATGGAGKLWRITDCPAGTTGDGLVLAHRVGAELVDLEMMLFYPSVIIWPPVARGGFLGYEFLNEWACDGEIRDKNGTPVLSKPMPVRDVAMRLMVQAIEEGRGTPHGGLWWDLTQTPKGSEAVESFFRKRPQYRHLMNLGLNPATQRIEVAPGAHYQLGGVYINERCETNVPGLYAAGELAGNMEGANRLGGNGLMATQTLSAQAAESAASFAKQNGSASSAKRALVASKERVVRLVAPRANGENPLSLGRVLQKAVWKHLGVRRSAEGLRALQSECSTLRTCFKKVKVAATGAYNVALLETLELEGMIDLAETIAGAALLREESRGHHYRVHFPEPDPEWLRHTVVQNKDGTSIYGIAPVIGTGKV